MAGSGVPGSSPGAGTGHLAWAQTDAPAETAARWRGGVGARSFLAKELGACGLSLSLIHVIFFYVL